MKLNIDFWTDDCKNTFYKKAKWLKSRGLTDKEIKNLLELLYVMVAQEFGF